MPTVARFKDSASARTSGTGPYVWRVKFSGRHCSPLASAICNGWSWMTVAAL